MSAPKKVKRANLITTVTLPGISLESLTNETKDVKNLQWIVADPTLGTGLTFVDKQGCQQFVPMSNVRNVQFEK